MEASPICLGITFPHDGQNSFVSPYFACTTAVNATASNRNVLINPTYAGSVVNRGPQSTGIQIVGTGNREQWQFPSAANLHGGWHRRQDGFVIVQYAGHVARGDTAVA